MNDSHQLVSALRLLCTALLLVCLSATAARAGLGFTSVRSGNWNDPCTWSNGCAAIPGPNDDVIIDNQHSVLLTTNVTVGSLVIDKGTGSLPTTLTVAANVALRVTGDMIVNASGRLVIEGGALVYVDGSSCVKNNGSVMMVGPAATPTNPDPVNGSLFLKGCVTVGSNCTDSFTTTNGTPNFINDANLNWCIACTNNNSATNTGNPANFCSVMMPVEFASFSATVLDGDGSGAAPRVALAWTTASETNNAYFSVERSTDGVHFTEILRLDGAGNATGPVAYREYDENPPFGTVYYRISQTDADGQAAASKPVSVQVGMGGKLHMSVSPVPLHGNALHISYTEAQAPAFQLLNALGVPVGAEGYSVTAEAYRATLTLARPLPPGVYYLRARSSGTIVTGKVIVP
ncbi:MAG: hypothetical protein AVDCRST_MAG56-2002 [uncultured Cytophagales bacterium]|uniref:Secretion system C-terminal sorting domain-containing protein n=1 Tax=uncultured Cytophagales bacterium TaxID=158755 RepID=A0A6J4ICQ2_9SPHI|nr:MAG: hypothetical protein AVDCRST_MAG56-2002 [uncultured Cytophagales bacterium]